MSKGESSNMFRTFFSNPTVGRILGVFLLVLVLYGLMVGIEENARSLENHQNIARRIGEWGILTLGAAFVIITGGIDLSIGSVVCLSAVSFGILLENGANPGRCRPDWPVSRFIDHQAQSATVCRDPVRPVHLPRPGPIFEPDRFQTTA